jgi:hypothetical protein
MAIQTLNHPSAIMQAAESCGLESVAKLFFRKTAFNSFLNALSKETLLLMY